jgi:hypothetical protein
VKTIWVFSVLGASDIANAELASKDSAVVVNIFFIIMFDSIGLSDELIIILGLILIHHST